MSIQHITENNEEARIRPSKTYQSFVAAAGGHRKLSFIEKYVRNYITKEIIVLGTTSGFQKCQTVRLSVNFGSDWYFSNFSRTFRRSSFMDPDLSRSPLLGRDEKHTKEREHACFFLTSLLRATAPLSNSSNRSREQRERIRCCRFSYRHTLCNKILNRISISACVYSREVQGSPSTI
ncbi:hypothetical protein Ahy_B06g080124 isoform A [Arachis hypogaea]|uniref:Uncharacterized protein n=1 Tax=Arachis hypogaea TaxID=3818 RepID=A0A444YH32_ARAHY|nr:hypothetical protein Ahy_B06g080124 isoform A [Arachis hypogaea]